MGTPVDCKTKLTAIKELVKLHGLKKIESKLDDIQKLRDYAKTDDEYFKLLGNRLLEVSEKAEGKVAASYDNAYKFKEAILHLDTISTKDLGAGLHSIVARTMRSDIEGGAHSVEAIHEIRFKEWMSNLYQDIDSSGVGYFMSKPSKEMEANVIQVMYSKRYGTKLPDNVSAEAEKIADLILKHSDYVNAMKIKSGVATGYEKGHLHFYWSSELVAGSKDSFIKFISNPNKVDHEAMGMSGLSSEELSEAANNMYTKIVSGEFGSIGNSSGTVSKLDRIRKVVMKDAEAHIEAANSFSDKNIVQSFLKESVTDIKNSTILEKLGTNPKDLISDLRKYVGSRIVNDGTMTPEQIVKLKAEMDTTELVLDTMLNPAKLNATDTKVKTARAIGNISMAAVLSGLTPFTLDPALVATKGMATYGASYFPRMGTYISTMMKAMSKTERLKLQRAFGMAFSENMDSLLSPIGTRISKDGGLNKILGWVMKLNGMEWGTKASRLAAAKTASMALGDLSDSAFDGLDLSVKNLLSHSRIGMPEWDFLRVNMNDGMLDLGHLRSLPLDSYKSLLSNSEFRTNIVEGLSSARVRKFKLSEQDLLIEAKNKIIEKSASYLYNYSLSVIPEKNMTQRVNFSTLDPNSHLAVFATLTKQFREFASIQQEAVLDAAWRSPKNAGKNPYAYMGAFVAMAFMGIYIKDTILSVLKGETPPDPSNPQWAMRAFSQNGILGIWGDLMMGTIDGIQQSSGDYIAGPSTRAMDNVFRLLGAVHSGDKAAASALDVAITTTPFSNIWYVKPMLNWGIINHLEKTLKPNAARTRETRLRDQNSNKNIMNRNYLMKREFLVKPKKQDIWSN